MKKVILDWRDRIQEGDILRSPGGKMRVVRKVSRKGDLVTFVTFTINHCSWTKRCTTTMERALLKKFQPTGVRVKTDTSELGKEIKKNIKNPWLRSLDCCDVHGIP